MLGDDATAPGRPVKRTGPMVMEILRIDRDIRTIADRR
jgi:hypothetical protein